MRQAGVIVCIDGSWGAGHKSEQCFALVGGGGGGKGVERGTRKKCGAVGGGSVGPERGGKR